MTAQKLTRLTNTVSGQHAAQVQVPGKARAVMPLQLSLALDGGATFVAGLTKEYEATTTATVISTAGAASLSVSKPGHMASLAEPLRVALDKTSWNAPTSKDRVGIAFQAAREETDPLRAGVYEKTITFTLAATQP